MDQDDLRRCADMSTAERKLACFESLLDGPRPAAVAEAPPVAEAPAAAVAPTAAVAPAVEETAPAAPAAAAKTATPQPGSDFGREYVEDDEEEEDDRQDVTATVNEVSPDRYKRLHFYFANGQVWRQLEARRFQYPKNEPFDVVISRGVLGDYQLRVGGEGRMTRIKRIK